MSRNKVTGDWMKGLDELIPLNDEIRMTVQFSPLGIAEVTRYASDMQIGQDFVGEIFNFHSVKDVQDLIAAKSYENKQIEDAAALLTTAQKARDPKWQADWDAFKSRYNTAIIKAAALIAASKAVLGPADLVTPDKAIPAEPSWDLVLRSLTEDPTKPYKDTDHQGLYSRLLKMNNFKAVDFKDLPQPSPDDNPDMQAFKRADDMQKAVNQAIAEVKEQGKKAGEAAWEWLKNPFVIAGGVALVGGILYVVTRRQTVVVETHTT